MAHRAKRPWLSQRESRHGETPCLRGPFRYGVIPSQSEARNDCAVWCAHTDIPPNSNLWQHRTIASASLRRLFAPLLQFEKREIHTGFETVEKGLCPFLTKGLQSAARTICTPLAYKSHTCSLSCIFCQVQEVNCPEGARETTLGCAPTENDQNPFAACGRQTLRGFFDTLVPPIPDIRYWGYCHMKYSYAYKRESCRATPRREALRLGCR